MLVDVVAKNIRYYRECENMPVEEFARRLGVSIKTVSNYENARSEPNACVVAHMAQILNVTTDQLLGIPV